MRQVMQNLILILFFGLLNLPKTTPCVASYGQCGGLEYTGETTCCEGSTCQYTNIWYSQCIPGAPAANTGCNTVWSQCGGQNWSGATCCVNSECVYSGPYYSQCLPSAATVSTSTKSTISTTTSSNAGQSSDCNTLWSQCGGQNWSGATCCIDSVCVYSNPYYSQCLQSGQSLTTISSSSSSSNSGSGTDTTTVFSGNGNRQAGVTTRYWDCCKPSCGWPGKASVTSPVQTCVQNGTTPVDNNTQSACTFGSAYMCNNQQPWNVSSTLSYGYAAARISGQQESDWCCACYSLIFTSDPIKGKELIVQVTNTGGDLGVNHFDLAMPGGGFGMFDGCTRQFGSGYSWGAQYGGVSQRTDCDNLPAVFQSGCHWRFDWFQNADNPTISFMEVPCPSVLTANTQCNRI